jgi:hypothetical protein
MDYLPETPTPEQRERARASDLYRRGDLRLVWVQESDLCPPLPRIVAPYGMVNGRPRRLDECE